MPANYTERELTNLCLTSGLKSAFPFARIAELDGQSCYVLDEYYVDDGLEMQLIWSCHDVDGFNLYAVSNMRDFEFPVLSTGEFAEKCRFL